MKSTLLTIFLLSFTSFLYAQNVVFADPNFEAALVADHLLVNTNRDSVIQLSEARACKILLIPNKGITDLSGIEEFKDLEILNANYNNIQFIDLSALENLKNVSITHSELDSLILANSLPHLNTIKVTHNLLRSIDLSGASNVFNIYIQNNNLDRIIFPNLAPGNVISRINCSHNQLKAFYQDAEYVDCGNNLIDTLDYSSSNFTETLIADSCQLRIMKISNRIKHLDVNYNQLDTLTIRSSSSIKTINCSFNQIKNFSSSNPNFTDLNISHNQLERLEINNNTRENIFNLDASSNDSLRCIQTNKSITNAQSSWTIPSQATISADCNGIWTSTTLLPSSNISIYPNPTSGNLQVELGQVYETVTIKVYNNVGQEVQTIYQEQTPQIMFDLPNFKGLYVIQIQTEQGQQSFSVLKD